jgi:RNA polymerase sigma factor (sigma-70 family)
MKKRWDLTQEEFDRLLHWLDSDRSRAGKKYEEIRLSLIKIFTWRGCSDAEGLADETINRVTQNLHRMADTYVGDPALYFYGVAKNLRREQVRQAGRTVPITPLVSPSAPPQEQEADEQGDDPELQYTCMRECIGRLKPKDRELFLLYYSGEKKSKNYRKDLAGQMGMTSNALRVRIKRLRTRLQQCIHACVELGRG